MTTQPSTLMGMVCAGVLALGAMAPVPAMARVAPDAVATMANGVPATQGMASRRLPARSSDFNGDGFVDLAIGVPDEDIGTTQYAGGVEVLYGSRSGLRSTADQWWSQKSRGVPGVPWTFGLFGYGLASGDFNRDGFADLAITARDGVYVLRGSRTGLTARGIRRWTASELGLSQTGFWGFTTARVGDFTGDGYPDLAVGYSAVEPHGDDGLLLAGGPGGISTPAIVHTGVPLAVGDASGDGIPDLLVGTSWRGGTWTGLALGSRQAPLRDRVALVADLMADVDADSRIELVRVDRSPGEVFLVSIWELGQPETLIRAHDLGIHGDRAIVNVTADDLTGDRAAELLISLREWGQDGFGRGAVAVIRGARGVGIVAQQAKVWSLSTPSVKGSDRHGSGFGAAVETGRFRGGTYADAAIGDPSAHVGAHSFADAGRITVLRGSRSGLTVTGQQQWTQDSTGIEGRAEHGDHFGAMFTDGPYCWGSPRVVYGCP